MPNPSWVVPVDVKFDGNPVDAAVLKDSGGVRAVVVWDAIPVSDQLIITELVDAYGGDAPLAAPVGGYQAVLFTSARLGATATGLANDATVYTVTVTVDGTAYPVSVVGSAAQTFTNLITEIDADLTGATTTLVGGNLRVTSDTTGLTSSVVISSDNLFRHLTAFVRIDSAKVGVDDLVEAMTVYKASNGEYIVNLVSVKHIGDKPPVGVGVQHTPEYLYFGGTPETWRYLDDDTEFVTGGGGGGGGGSSAGSPDFAF